MVVPSCMTFVLGDTPVSLVLMWWVWPCVGTAVLHVHVGVFCLFLYIKLYYSFIHSCPLFRSISLICREMLHNVVVEGA